MADREEKSWLLGRSRKFAIIFRGTVDCGFDMRRARITVFEGKKRVEVNFAHCEIQRVWLNLESGDRAGIKVYDQQAGIFAPNLTLDEQNEVVAASLQKIRQKAYQDWDVILKAEDNAVKLYKSFLALFNYTVSVVFTDDDSKLGVPSDERSDTMKGGGALIIHTAKECHIPSGKVSPEGKIFVCTKFYRRSTYLQVARKYTRVL